MTTQEAKLEPRDLAAKEGKTVIYRIMGPMVAVFYPYRRSGDMYVVGPEEVTHCCQCDQDFPTEGFLEHVNTHNSKLKKFPDIIIDSGLVAPAETE